MRNRARLRLAYTTWPRPRVVLADTPRPTCPDCYGDGGWDEGGPFEDEPTPVTCGCWDPDDKRTVVVVPRWVARRFFGHRDGGGWSSEPPF
ncbi:hypothetical protein [Streptomyces niveiscabiei]|uniref:Uncharacterized protein n=1 Tax=Streptomyces niveiscabiei TaxID=164115 RepID=A0ABW9I0K8_9ACTN